MSDTLRMLLDGKLTDPGTGGPLVTPVRNIIVRESLAGSEAELVASAGLGSRIAVVSDPDTHAALGQRVVKALAGAVRVIPIRLPRRPEPDTETVEGILAASASADGYLAVGSGTINDLCKYAAARSAKPYAVFATAPSMNGYASRNASITVRGLKRTLPAVLPAGVFIDLGVLAAAPPRLIRAGVGDTICRPTVQADWLLAHLLRGDAYWDMPFRLIAKDEEMLHAEPEALLAADKSAMECLASALLLAGLAMSMCGGSQPTSQGEHLISHYMELTMGRTAGGGAERQEDPESYHGEQIGVTTITMARLQRAVLDADRLTVHPSDISVEDLHGRLGEELAQECWQEFLPKRLDAQGAEELNGRLSREWDAIRGRISEAAMDPARLTSTLSRMGAPLRPDQLGWPSSDYALAVAHAAEIRNRYTFLDLARDARIIDAPFVDSWDPAG
jgi:glycerol-1-phosphate dehydrogenase [NAD(P)+]